MQTRMLQFFQRSLISFSTFEWEAGDPNRYAVNNATQSYQCVGRVDLEPTTAFERVSS